MYCLGELHLGMARGWGSDEFRNGPLKGLLHLSEVNMTMILLRQMNVQPTYLVPYIILWKIIKSQSRPQAVVCELH